MTRKNGFTLIELSIVLVIIGLITGGILVGQSLIRGSEIQSVVTEAGRYTQAVIDFRDKYMALPGDFAGATALWGSDASCPNTPYTTTPHTTTCNGNGDGHIGNITVDGGATNYEQYRAWQQLSNAGMIDGAYSGTTQAGTPTNPISYVGINEPASKLPGAGWWIAYISLPAGNPENFPVTSHVLEFGSNHINATSKAHSNCPVITPVEALAIDSKMDDGNPATGIIMAFKSPLNRNCNVPTNCTTSDTAPTSYNTSDTHIDCAFFFLPGF